MIARTFGSWSSSSFFSRTRSIQRETVLPDFYAHGERQGEERPHDFTSAEAIFGFSL